MLTVLVTAEAVMGSGETDNLPNITINTILQQSSKQKAIVTRFMVKVLHMIHVFSFSITFEKVSLNYV